MQKSKENFLKTLSENFLNLLKIVKSYFSGEFDMFKSDLMIIIGTIVYVASPIDALPDFIPIAGFLDDAIIVGIVMEKFKDLIDRYNREFK